MEEHSQISIEELIKIADKLTATYFQSRDLYSLLVLALLTVTQYSREKRHLNTAIRLELTVTFLPDLLSHLLTSKIVSKEEYEALTAEITKHFSQIPIILQSYIYVANGLRGKEKEKKKNKSSCVLM